MDEYLVPNASFLRLLNEYRVHNSLVIAYDLDNTIYDFHKKGHTYAHTIQLLKDLKEIGCYMICFTANADTKFVNQYLYDNNIPHDAINENPPFFKCDQRKIYFNALLDDRAGLIQVFSELRLLVEMVNKDR